MFNHFSAENISFKIDESREYPKVLVSNLEYLCFNDFSAENISFKSADGQNRRRKLYPHFLDIFGCPKKCPFWPFRAANFKIRNAKPQKTGL